MQKKYDSEIKMIREVYDELDLQRNELMRPPGSMNYRDRPRLREEIMSILFAIDRVPAKQTSSQIERSETLIQETVGKAKILEETKENAIRKINDLQKPIPMLNMRVKSTRA